MGSIFTRLFSKLITVRDLRILILGLDGAGKTTILYSLKIGEVINTTPTIGFNVETVQYKNMYFTVWDVGGQAKIRNLWQYYYKCTAAVIYVVDSSDTERMDLARDELKSALKSEDLTDAALLVYANKQDLGVMSVSEVAKKLELDSIKDRKWYIQGASALKGEGLYEGMEWLCKTLKDTK